MRLIGTIDNAKHAEKFAAFLATEQIASHVDLEGEVWEVWVRDEDQVERAKGDLEQFLENPDDARYKNVLETAQLMMQEEVKRRREIKKNVVDVKNQWRSPGGRMGRTPLVVLLIVISVVVFFLTRGGQEARPPNSTYMALAFKSLSLQDFESIVARSNNEVQLRLRSTFGSVLQGQVWRLVTPIFMHGDLLHIAFNMFVLVIFGRQVESRYGTAWLGLLVLVFAIVSNSAQALAGPPNQLVSGFLGMSGVGYGLFGYVWMKMVFDPSSQLYVSPFNIVLLVGLMLFFMIPNQSSITGQHIANWAHAFGLVAGMTAGYLPKLARDLGLGDSKRSGRK